jgi:hypothetical protein
MSLMYMVDPVDFAMGQLISTTATETLSTWTSGTYAAGAQVVYPDSTGITRKWQSLVAANTATPGTDETKWKDIGPANRVAMFDNKNSTQTTTTNTLQVVIQPGSVVTSVGLFNLLGGSVRVEVLSAANVVLYDKSINLAERKTANFTQYYFGGFGARLTQAIFGGLPLSITAKIRVTITGSGTVGCGRMVYGRRQDLGKVLMGAQPTFSDYSREEWDPDFGDYTWTVRDFARGFSGRMVVHRAQLNNVWLTIIGARAKPTLYVVSENPDFSETLVTLGVMQDLPASIDHIDYTLLSFNVKGLT